MIFKRYINICMTYCVEKVKVFHTHLKHFVLCMVYCTVLIDMRYILIVVFR